MEAIEKLRAMTEWYNNQSEYSNYAFNSLKGLERAYDYARASNLEFIDNDYLFDNFEGAELEKHLKAINKFQKL